MADYGRSYWNPRELALRASKVRGVSRSWASIWRQMVKWSSRLPIEPCGRIIWHPPMLAKGLTYRWAFHQAELRDVDLQIKCVNCGAELCERENRAVWRAITCPTRKPRAALCGECAHCARDPNLHRQFLHRAGFLELEKLCKALASGAGDRIVKEDYRMRTTADLRSSLIDDFKALRAGEISRAEARARSYVAKQIIETVKVECVASMQNVDQYDPVILEPAPHAQMIAAE